MRELRVEDALLYLDQVKMEFSDRPHIYNEFLDIMKTFKTQQIDTPGVIRRVSNLFQGNKALVLGFNTFLPEGYKIELPQDGDGQPVAVYRAPGQTGVTHILGPNAPPLPAPLPNPPPAQSATIMRAQQQQQHPLQQQKQQQLQQQQPTISQSQPQQQSRPQFLQTQQHSISAPTMGGMVEYQQRVPPGPPQQPRLTHPMASVPKPLSRPTMLAAATSAPQPPHPPQQQPSAQQASTAKQPVEFDHAINYVTTIKNRFAGEPDTYKKFLEILHTYQKEQRGIKEVLDEVSLLFADHPDLLKEFTFFLPDAVQAQAKAQLEKAAKESEARIRANASRQAIMQQAQGMQQAATGPPPRRASVPNAPPQAQPIPQQVVVQQVISQQVSPQQVVQQQVMPPQVMPSQVIPSQTMPSQGVPVQVLPPQVAPQLEPSPEPERSYSPSPAPIPFGASQGRSEEREREIIRSAVHGIVSFTPSPPPRRAEISASQAAQKYGRPQIIPDLPTQPTTAEAAFFERAKLHLNRKELAPDKPPGSRRHTPYTEFLKCLHLFGAGILSKDELVLLLKGLFMQGHAPKSGSNAGGGASNPAVANDAQELLREFEEILVGRGHFADQENLLKDKSKYGDKQVRDFDFSGCEKPTPSYRTIPSDYPTNLFHSHSGQSGMDASVLNNTLLCLPARRSTRFVLSPDEYDGPSERNNIYEENMFKVEDERYEVDMAIERNGKAMCDVEPISQEISRLKDQEEKDGQPIGRMQYKLRPRQLKSFHIGAIGRLYGDHGDEVVQQLLRNPIAVLPIVYQRLRDKDSEWRKVKGESMKKWALINEENYLGSLDVLSFENKRMLGRLFDEKHLIKEIKHVRSLPKASNPLATAPPTKEFFPDFVAGSEDQDTLIYQSYMTTIASLESPHKDAHKLISRKILWAKSLDEKLMVARVWAEIIVPFFDYPTHWISDELQNHGIEGKSALIVKYCLGQSVVTAYGKGTIISILESNQKADFRYKISLSYGTAYVRPESILHLSPGRGKFVRQNNRMQASTLSTEGSGICLNPKFSLMFGNHNMYIFFRMYILLIQILASSKECLEQQPENDILSETPNPNKKFKYVDFLSKLQQVLKKEISSLDFERACRSASIHKVAQMAVLPKLIEKCANFVCKLSRDPTVFALYDCSIMIQSDPIRLRSCCLSVNESASYRIQYDKKSGWIYISYLELEQDLMVVPEYDEEEDEDEHEEDHEIDAVEDYHDEMMGEENDGEGDDDNGDNSDDCDLQLPDSKRPKFE